MKKHNHNFLDLNECLKGLNDLLSKNGFDERFTLTEFTYKNKVFEKLMLNHLTEKGKIIEFFNERKGGKLYFLNTYVHICYLDDFEENIEQIFERVKCILENKVVTVFRKTKMGEPIMEGSATLSFDVDSFSYGERERELLSDINIEYSLWTGGVPENVKLFTIGNFFTNMWEIQLKWKELREKNEAEWYMENVLWEGKPSKKASVFFPLK